MSLYVGDDVVFIVAVGLIKVVNNLIDTELLKNKLREIILVDECVENSREEFLVDAMLGAWLFNGVVANAKWNAKSVKDCDCWGIFVDDVAQLGVAIDECHGFRWFYMNWLLCFVLGCRAVQLANSRRAGSQSKLL